MSKFVIATTRWAGLDVGAEVTTVALRKAGFTDGLIAHQVELGHLEEVPNTTKRASSAKDKE